MSGNTSVEEYIDTVYHSFIESFIGKSDEMSNDFDLSKEEQNWAITKQPYIKEFFQSTPISEELKEKTKS